MTVELDTTIDVEEKLKEMVKEPSKFKVIFADDNETPMEFVVELLIGIFRHSSETARTLTMNIHDAGSAIVGLYGFEIAEQKALEATRISRESGFPLQVVIEKE
mgnify:FL=1